MSGRPPWLYLDADGFFASCEEAADPRLHGRPVGVVAGSAYADAPLIAVNTVAKRAGVRSGDRVCEARKLCPGFAVRPQRVERYVDVHARMVCAVGAVLPVTAVHSIDELSARLSRCDDPECVVDQVKRSVSGELTRLVPVSVGVAPSAWLAKCAAEANKPDAAVVWRRGDLPGVYTDLELEDLPGAGPRICRRLRMADLATVASIYSASRSRIISAWGSIEGERVRLALRGEDVPARVTRRRSIAHGRVLTGRDRCWREARQIVRWLAVCALHRCADGGHLPARVGLEVVTVAGVMRCAVGRLGGFGYGRIVAMCRVGGADLNAWMVELGRAVAYRKCSRRYVSREASRRAERREVWREGVRSPPSRLRRAERLSGVPRSDSGECCARPVRVNRNYRP